MLKIINFDAYPTVTLVYPPWDVQAVHKDGLVVLAHYTPYSV